MRAAVDWKTFFFSRAFPLSLFDWNSRLHNQKKQAGTAAPIHRRDLATTCVSQSRILRLTMERPTKRSRVATRRDDDDSVVDADVRTASKTLLQRFLGGTTTTSDEFLRTVFRKKHFHARGGASELSRWILSEEAFGLSDLSLDRMLELTPSPQIHAWLKRSNAAAPDSTPLDSIAVEDARAAAVLHAAGARFVVSASTAILSLPRARRLSAIIHALTCCSPPRLFACVLQSLFSRAERSGGCPGHAPAARSRSSLRRRVPRRRRQSR